MKEEIETLVRDICEVPYRGKSEVRSRIMALLENVRDEISPKEQTFPPIESDDYDAGYEYCRQEILARWIKILGSKQ